MLYSLSYLHENETHFLHFNFPCINENSNFLYIKTLSSVIKGEIVFCLSIQKNMLLLQIIYVKTTVVTFRLCLAIQKMLINKLFNYLYEYIDSWEKLKFTENYLKLLIYRVHLPSKSFLLKIALIQICMQTIFQKIK